MILELLKKKYIHFLFIILLISLPISKASASVALVLLFADAIIRLFRNPTQHLNTIPTHKSLILIGGLFFVYMSGLLYSQNLQAGLDFLYANNGFFTIPFIVWINRQLIVEKFTAYLTYFTAATVVSCIITLGFYMLSEAQLMAVIEKVGFLQEYTPQRSRLMYGLYSPFIGRIQFCNLVGIAILACSWLFMTKKHRLFSFFSGAFLLVSSVYLGGRAAQLGILFAAFIFTLGFCFYYIFPYCKKQFNNTKIASVITTSLVTLLLASPFLAYQNLEPIQKRYGQMFWELQIFQDNTFENYKYEHFTCIRRLVSWQNSWEIVKASPILGVGTGDYYSAMQQVYDADKFKIPVNSHSQYLQIWVTAGLLGLAFFVFVILHWLVAIYRSENRMLFVFAAAYMGFYLIVFALDAVLLRQVDNMTFPFFMSGIAAVAVHYGLENKIAKTPTTLLPPTKLQLSPSILVTPQMSLVNMTTSETKILEVELEYVA
ncbi:MAG: O-antigen ligase family protein [Chitinophagales bacterium]